MEKRFNQIEKKEPKGYPGRHSTTLSNEGEKAYQDIVKRFPALNDSDILELAVLILKDAPPASIRKVVETRDLVVESREREAKKAGKHQETAPTGAEAIA